MFKIPESFKLGGIYYSVKMFRERSGGMGLGQHDGKNSVIEIAQDVSPDRQAKTFVHECLHGVIEQHGVDIPDEQEERIVRQLTTGITEIIDQVVEFNQDEKEPKYGSLLIRQICEVDRILLPLLDRDRQSLLLHSKFPVDFKHSKEDDPNGFCAMVAHTRRIAELLKEQIEHDKKATTDHKRIGKLANRIAEYYKKEGNGCGGNCHLVLDDGNLEDSDIQFCKGYCAHADDKEGLGIMIDMLSMSPEERQKVYDTASVLTNPRYTNNLDNPKEKE